MFLLLTREQLNTQPCSNMLYSRHTVDANFGMDFAKLSFVFTAFFNSSFFLLLSLLCHPISIRALVVLCNDWSNEQTWTSIKLDNKHGRTFYILQHLTPRQASSKIVVTTACKGCGYVVEELAQMSHDFCRKSIDCLITYHLQDRQDFMGYRKSILTLIFCFLCNTAMLFGKKKQLNKIEILGFHIKSNWMSLFVL